jgi:hypothetical protein
MSEASPSEFYRPVVTTRLPREGTQLDLAADAGERAALARRFQLLALHRLEAQFTVEPWRRGGVRVRGSLVADLEQQCVVTLEPIGQHVEEAIERLYLPAEALPEPGAELEVPSLDEEPEPLRRDGSIDLGEVAAEALALVLDPYPRKPGVSFEEVYRAIETAPGAERGAGERPFAVLERLKKEGS